MASKKEKELRQMNRTELIEIIYALQQNEKNIRAENEQLNQRLDDKILRIENSGSIAEAALSLNHIFEDAQKAAEQYLESLKEKETALQSVQESDADQLPDKEQASETDMQRQTEEVIAQANEQATQIIAQANAQADKIIAQANAQADKTIADANAQAEAALQEASEAEQRIRRMAAALKKQRKNFLYNVNAFMEENPDFAQRMGYDSGDDNNQGGETSDRTAHSTDSK